MLLTEHSCKYSFCIKQLRSIRFVLTFTFSQCPNVKEWQITVEDRHKCSVNLLKQLSGSVLSLYIYNMKICKFKLSLEKFHTKLCLSCCKHILNATRLLKKEISIKTKCKCYFKE